MLEEDTKTSSDSSPESGGPSYESIAPIDFEPSGRGTTARLGGNRWLLFGILALLALLTAFAVFMFTSRSVLFSVTPVPDELELAGSPLRFELGGRWLLQPGEYTISARKAGYYDLQESVQVLDDNDQVFSFQLTKLPGYLEVTTTPETASRVWIDGQSVGSTPLDGHELRPGEYQVAVRARRYEVWEQSVLIEGGEMRQSIRAELLPAWAEITVTSSPAGATLSVDGEPVGETPLTAEILAGARTLSLGLDGYKSWSTELEVTARQAVDMEPIVLEKADTVVNVASSPGGASVTVDGEYRGQTPTQLMLAPGQRYRIGFAKAGYESNQRLLDVVAGDDTSLQVRLRPILGEVTLAGSPGDAAVVVDGIARGGLNERMRLAAHPHRIEVRKEGYEPFTTTVTPNPDLAQRVEVNLVSLEDIAAARMPDLLTTSTGHQLKLVKPSGIFRMGSGRREQGRRSNEFMHQVQLQRPFYVGLKEVTNAEFQAYDSQHDSGVIERQTLSLKQQPAVRVNWDDAARFCNWLSDREGLPPAYRDDGTGSMVAIEPMTLGYRLLSEAEWAYVARYGGRSEGRAASRYPWGDGMPPPAGSGNYAGAEATGLVERPLVGFGDDFPGTAPVGVVRGPLGVFDLGGNVHEWIHDHYVIHAGALGNIPVDPLGPAKAGTHVVRGSSWRSVSITELRLAFRDEGREGADDIGFRIGRYAE